MALSATIYKIHLSVADLDRGYYADHALTLARHPSETEQRLMLRVLAFAMQADERLEFGRGLSAEDEPDLWRKSDTGVIEQWIEVGLPDERLLRRACGRAARVWLLTYGGAKADVWWRKNAPACARLDNLAVLVIDEPAASALAALAIRGSRLAATVQDGEYLFSGDTGTVRLEPRTLKPFALRGP
ncbi:MAG: YaeQ family protein [Burkholderiaceae bacterium]